MDCTFCKIVSGHVESYKIVESADALAFLDIYPVTKGHVLVIPKKHFKDLFEIPDEDLKQTVVLAKKVAKRVREVFDCDVNLLHASGAAAQQSEFHFHVHIVARRKDDGLDLWPNYEAAKIDFEKLREELQ